MTAVISTGRPMLLSARRMHGRADLAAHRTVHGPCPRADLFEGGRLVATVAAAGLLGRGGGGFPVWAKLDAARRHRCGTVVVNAMEGEPASGKDAVLLLSAPHLVLEGAQLVAAISRARRVVACVASNRDDMATSLSAAMGERRVHAPSEVPVELVRPPGRYIAGEESALVGWLARGRGAPVFRPDKAVPLMLGRAAVVVHNPETLAQVALVARVLAAHPEDDPAGVGADVAARLTALVTVSGAVTRPGVVEVPLGTSVSSIIELAGPGEPASAALVGGFGGVWLGRDQMDVPYRAEELRAVGAAPGAGVLVALPETACGLAESARIASWMASESAGQCGPCLYGLPAVARDLSLLASGRPDPRLMDRLTGRLDIIEGRGGCRHPDGVVRMVRTALSVFRADVDRHLRGRPCRYAGTRLLTCIP